ncbi:glycosyltransferase [Rossellomorea arthrocnemi]
MTERNVVIFRDKLLPTSETFVKAQSEGLSSFVPYYAGYQKIKKGLDLNPDRTIVIHGMESRFNNRYTEKHLKKFLIDVILYNKIKRKEPELIHAHFGPDGTIALPLAQKLNVPLLVSFHGYDVTRTMDHLKSDSAYNIQHYVKHMKDLKQSDTIFIAASKYIKRKLIEKGFPPKQIKTHYIGIDLDKLKKDSTIQREETILFVGRLVENKGCDYLIRAMKVINDKNPHVKLLVAGDGPERENLETLAKNLNVNSTFLGAIPHKEVVERMNNAKVFSVPSVEVESGASEGFGMVFAEAQAMGLPVVSFDTGGIPEAVSHNETGFIVPQRDFHQLANYILRLFDDPSLWEKFSQSATERVLRHFDLKKQNKMLETIYENTLSKYKRSCPK